MSKEIFISLSKTMKDYDYANNWMALLSAILSKDTECTSVQNALKEFGIYPYGDYRNDNAVMTCKVQGCLDFVHRRGMCRSHFYRFTKYGDATHELQRRQRSANIDICTAYDCKNVAYLKGYCHKHLYRLRKYGDVNRTQYNSGGCGDVEEILPEAVV